jgi:pyruvate kinase
MSAGDVEQALRRVRDLTDTPVVIDLQGAKMRLGSFSPRPLRAGEPIVLALDATEPSIPLPHAEIFRNARPGDTLSCDDDRVHLRIDSVASNRLVATSLSDGTLKPRKGVNVVEHPVHLEDLTASDVAQIEVARSFEGVSFACSFMRDGREASWIRERAPGAKVVGKIERAEALEAIAAIAACVDAVWICRGDLGAQVGLTAMARWVSAFRPETLPVPTLMAGQVLEHLTQHANPTRSEVCHLHDLLRRGYAGLVLSDETAIGHDPVRATTLASDLLRTMA